jgi:asparagine synthase (glutamine-hydrolysing)
MGVKPLYYVRLHDSFAFASEMKPLLSIPKVGLDLDPVTLSSHISFIWAPAPHTMCREVRKLEPGRILVVSDRGRRVDFEEWEPASSHAPVCALTDRDVVECVRTTLRDSVQRQMVSDVPVGAFLSGGLDSSAVVSLARDSASAGGLDCFTWGNRNAEVESEGFQSDLPFAKLVSDHLSVSLNVAQEVPDLASGLATVIRCVEEPLADFAALSTYIIAGAARERGIKVLLSGVGGDDLFAGYRRHQAIQWDSAWDRLPIGMRRSIAKVTGLLPASSPAFRRLRKICTLAARSQADRFIDYFRWVEPEVAARLLAAREAPLELGGATKLIGDSYTRLRRDGNDVLSSMLKIEQQFYLPDHNLLYTDKMGMAAGVEVRVPLLDLSIVGLMNSLPSRFKIRGATTKWALRSAMQGVLPESVLRRSKVGFGIPLRKWLHGRLMVDCGHLIDEESVRNRGLFSAPAIRALREDDRAGRVDAAYTLLSLMCVELWCRQFLDQVSQIRSVDVRMEVEKYQASSAVRSAV